MLLLVTLAVEVLSLVTPPDLDLGGFDVGFACFLDWFDLSGGILGSEEIFGGFDRDSAWFLFLMITGWGSSSLSDP